MKKTHLPILSFIVPVYNVASYLRKCVESLIKQDYDSYELILVDDGSTDGSSDICDEYVQRVKSEELRVNSIKVIHQTNGGLSAARNAGMKVAKGEYVCFVDSDDYWEPNVLGGLMEQVERENLDVLRFDYQNVRIKNEGVRELENEGEYEVFEPDKRPHQVDRQNEVVDGETYLNTRMGYACYAVMFIIKQSLIYNDEMSRDKSLNEPLTLNDACLFKEGIYFEDTEWTPKMLLGAKRVAGSQTIVYNYFWREGSITKAYSEEHIQKKIASLLNVNLSLQSLLSKVEDKRWIYGCIADNVYGILNNVAAYDYKSTSYWIGELKEKNMLPLRGYKIRKMTRLRYGIINMSPRIYCWLRHMRKEYL